MIFFAAGPCRAENRIFFCFCKAV